MTNTTLLKAKIDASGYKMKYIANRIGLSYQGFLNKIRNKTDFTAPEIKSLCELLHIGTEEMEQIFFAPQVDCLPTSKQEDHMDTTIHINVADIPPEVGESFGRVTLAGFKKFIAQPGNREKLEAQTAARKARKERECKE